MTALIEQAEQHEANGLWAVAAETWASVVSAEPTAYGFLRYSSALQDAGQLNDAEVAARKALELGATSPRFE